MLYSPQSSPHLTLTTPSAVSSPSSKREKKVLSTRTVRPYLHDHQNSTNGPPNPRQLYRQGSVTSVDFLEKTHSRNLTPGSQIFLDLYQRTSLLLLSETDHKEGIAANKPAALDKFIEENSTILNGTKSHAEIRENLSRLKLFEFYSRYGDYFAYQSSQLKKTATEIQP